MQRTLAGNKEKPRVVSSGLVLYLSDLFFAVAVIPARLPADDLQVWATVKLRPLTSPQLQEPQPPPSLQDLVNTPVRSRQMTCFGFGRPARAGGSGSRWFFFANSLKRSERPGTH